VRIAFDHQAFCLQKSGGISRYFFKLAEGLANEQENVGVFSPLYRNTYARQLANNTMHGAYIKDYPARCADVAVALNGMVARRQLRAWRPDIVHETYFSNHRSGATNTPTVLTIFDMIGELGLDGATPTSAELRASKKYAAVKRADHVICISEHTRQDLIRLYDVPPEKTTTIHLGCEVQRSISITTPVHTPYLLYVGLRAGYKNFNRFLHAVASSKQLKHSFDIVAFGGGKFSDVELAALRELNFTANQVRQIEGDDNCLASYYTHASALVYPSVYEGFGLPPLEAMAYQCPVVSSQASVMPEIISDAAEFFDPLNIEAMATAIERVVSSSVRAQELVDRGLERIQQFTWNKCVQRHIDLYAALDPAAARIQ
jgi:glycosyltransferase involved in cell wall biosynthesis